MIPALKSRAAHALAHRDLTEILGCIPAAERSDPRLVASWLRAAASVEPRLADLPSFRAATGAVQVWGEGQALADRAAALWWDDRVRAEFGEGELQWIAANPAAAYRSLLRDGHTRIGDRDLLQSALEVLKGAEILAGEHGLPWNGREAAAPAIPADAAGQNDEYDRLIGIPPNKLTAEQHQRLLQLADRRIERDDAEMQRAATVQQPQPAAASDGEYRSLIARSLKGPLSPADEAKLGRLATQRALDEGRLDPAEAFADPSPAAPVRGRAAVPEPRVAAFDDAAAHARAVAAGVAGMYPNLKPQPSTSDGADGGAEGDANA